MQQLLSIIERGGYQNFNPLYATLGYTVEIQTTMRKALKFLKKNKPAVIVAEFNFQSDFRDRTSSLESLMSVVQRMPTTQVIIFYDQEFVLQLARLEARFTFASTLAFPIEDDKLKRVLLALE
ncbi:MAG: hypothetical protein KAG28_07655 [Cocleimonas sp.]|nr:hypothetical protein [Cocleimonas sp.]